MRTCTGHNLIIGSRLGMMALMTFLSCVVTTFSQTPVYWAGRTNVVIAVSAYERERILPNGERIKVFSTDMDPLCTNYTAILFSVLHPAELRGKLVRLAGVPGELSSLDGFLPQVYRMDTLYYIPFVTKRDHGNVKALEPSDFFWMGETNSQINVVSQEATIYYWNESDAQMRLSELMEKEKRCSNEALVLERYLRSHPRPLRTDDKFKEWSEIRIRHHKRVHSDIPYYQAEQTNILRQIEKIQTLNLGANRSNDGGIKK